MGQDEDSDKSTFHGNARWKRNLRSALNKNHRKADGYEAIKHQQFVGAGFFDQITQTVTGGRSAVLAMEGSTEEEQFDEQPARRVANA